mmetsp:Transcript_20543/g.30877  ORF Transcript_20543/g.30877 Transcript_20543/m.30877 type:complete len:227 (+) Transcript_20543:131-811(+)
MSHANNGNPEVLVDKITAALAALRNERDDLHRQKSLAEERMRLVEEEKEALQQSVADARLKYSQLQSQASSEEAKQELQDLERDVTMLQKEVDFQHAELVAKRIKLDSAQKCLLEEIKKLEKTSLRMKEAERKRRNQVARQTLTKGILLESMQAALEQQKLESDFSLEESLPRWISISTDELKSEADRVHCENQQLSKVMVGYKKYMFEKRESPSTENSVLGNSDA